MSTRALTFFFLVARLVVGLRSSLQTPSPDLSSIHGIQMSIRFQSKFSEYTVVSIVDILEDLLVATVNGTSVGVPDISFTWKTDEHYVESETVHTTAINATFFVSSASLQSDMLSTISSDSFKSFLVAQLHASLGIIISADTVHITAATSSWFMAHPSTTIQVIVQTHYPLSSESNRLNLVWIILILSTACLVFCCALHRCVRFLFKKEMRKQSSRSVLSLSATSLPTPDACTPTDNSRHDTNHDDLYDDAKDCSPHDVTLQIQPQGVAQNQEVYKHMLARGEKPHSVSPEYTATESNTDLYDPGPILTSVVKHGETSSYDYNTMILNNKIYKFKRKMTAMSHTEGKGEMEDTTALPPPPPRGPSVSPRRDTMTIAVDDTECKEPSNARGFSFDSDHNINTISYAQYPDANQSSDVQF